MSHINREKNTQSALYCLIILGQCFAIFPVTGIAGQNYRTLKFKWLSLRTFYSLMFIAFLLINLGFYTHNIFQEEQVFGIYVGLHFFTCCLLTSLLFLDLARKWPKVMKKWADVDQIMSREYGFPSKLDRKIKVIIAAIMISALVEHSLFLATRDISAKNGIWGIIKNYFENNYAYVFKYVRYNLILGFLWQIFNIFCTFTWNYMDLFVIIISLTLSARYSQVVKKLQNMAELKIKEQKSWQLVREDYNRLNLLCKTLDESIANIILLSFANNIFIILVQLFFSLKPKKREDLVERIYFVFSFGFLIARTVAVALYGATIDAESREPANILNTLPHDIYNVEIQRFIRQVKIDPAAFTGKQMFTITKSLILEVAGAIVTYELIMIQFNKTNQ